MPAGRRAPAPRTRRGASTEPGLIPRRPPSVICAVFPARLGGACRRSRDAEECQSVPFTRRPDRDTRRAAVAVARTIAAHRSVAPNQTEGRGRGDGIMSEKASAEIVDDAAGRRAELERRIIGFIQKEIQDKSAVLTRDTRREDVAIDSIDVVNVIFALEETFDVEIDLPTDAKFETVGDLVDRLIGFLPEGEPSST
ncbi:MAG: acyl carrier protein [Phyllobacteriaceae bacterium]|nr:acyl carrier protein [Phyllobacteriaceae bacterium]